MTLTADCWCNDPGFQPNVMVKTVMTTVSSGQRTLMKVVFIRVLQRGHGSGGCIDVTVYTQVLPNQMWVVSSLGTHLTHVRLQVPRWRLYMVLDLMSMHAHDCGPFEGLLHTPSAGTHKQNSSPAPQQGDCSNK